MKKENHFSWIPVKNWPKIDFSSQKNKIISVFNIYEKKSFMGKIWKTYSANSVKTREQTGDYGFEGPSYFLRVQKSLL